MDIYILIHQDHEAARALIDRINTMPDTRHPERLLVFNEFKRALRAHNEAEEASFYHALELHAAAQEDITQSKHEHHDADDMLAELENRHLTPEQWRTKFEHFQTALFQHITEEESKIFGEARQLLSPQTAVELARIMQNLKQMQENILHRAS